MQASMSVYSSLNIQLSKCMKFLASSNIPLCVYGLWKPIIMHSQILLNQLEQGAVNENTKNLMLEIIALLESARFAPSPCNVRTYIAEVIQMVDRFMNLPTMWESEAPRVKELLAEPTPFQRMIGVLGSEMFLQAPMHCCLQPEHEVLQFMCAFKQYYHAAAKAKLLVEGLGQSMSRHDIDNLFQLREQYASMVERTAPRIKEVLRVDQVPLICLPVDASPVPEELRDAAVHFVPQLTEDQYHEYLSLMEAYLVALCRDDFRVLGVNAFVNPDWEVSVPDLHWAQGVGPLASGVAGLLERHEPYFTRMPPWPMLPPVIVDFTTTRDLNFGGEPVLVSACCGQTSVIYLADVGPHAGNSMAGAANHMRDAGPTSRRMLYDRNKQKNSFALGKWVARWNFNACRGQKRFFVHDTKSFISARASAVTLRQEVETKFSAARSEPVIKRFPETYQEGFWVSINYDEYTAQQVQTWFSVDAYGFEFARNLAHKCSQMTKLTYKRPTNTTLVSPPPPMPALMAHPHQQPPPQAYGPLPAMGPHGAMASVAHPSIMHHPHQNPQFMQGGVAAQAPHIDPQILAQYHQQQQHIASMSAQVAAQDVGETYQGHGIAAQDTEDSLKRQREQPQN